MLKSLSLKKMINSEQHVLPLKSIIKDMKTLKIGDKVPNFTALDQDGNSISLLDYKGKKLIVFFYPKASTPGCTVEACNLRDNYELLQNQGFELLGVSADSQKRQTNFF